MPVSLDAPIIPDVQEDQPNLDEIIEQASDIIEPSSSPQIPTPPTQPTQQRSQPIPIPIKPPDYSSHELADVLLKAQYLKLKNLI